MVHSQQALRVCLRASAHGCSCQAVEQRRRGYKAPPLEGEGVDAPIHQTQPYEASASPIFWPVSWPCVGQVRAMSQY